MRTGPRIPHGQHDRTTCPTCRMFVSIETAERRDTERIASELRDQLDANPALADAVIRNLLLNPAADVIDAIAEAVNNEERS